MTTNGLDGTETRVDRETNIIWKRLQSTADDMLDTVFRLAFAFSIREADGASSVLTTPSGDAVGVSRRSVPVLVGAVRRTIQHVLENHFEVDELQPGDVIITNDPWLGGGHLPDIVVVTPIFYENELVGFAGSLGNVDDIGGISGMWLTEASQVYEEGLIIPPVKLYEAGEKNDAVEAFVRKNVRLPDQDMGDIEAMISAHSRGSVEVSALIDEYGLSTYRRATDAILDRAENALRTEIEALPDGAYTAEHRFSMSDILVEHDDLVVKAAVEIDGSEIHVDYAGTSEQIPAGINAPFTNVRAVTEYVIRSLTLPTVDGCTGLARPVEVTAPPGTLVNAQRPVATGSRHLTYFAAEFCVLKAFSELFPDRLLSDFSAGLQIVNVNGTTDEGEEFVGVALGCKPEPAHANRDGQGVTHFPSNARLVSIEMVEQYNPILFESTNMVPDTEGAGRYRSEFAPEWVIRNNLSENDVNALITSAAGARRPEGVSGGRDGRMAAVELVDRDEPGPTNGRITLEPQERIRVRRSSPGGFGDPTERPVDEIEQDVRADLLSEERAREVYEY